MGYLRWIESEIVLIDWVWKYCYIKFMFWFIVFVDVKIEKLFLMFLVLMVDEEVEEGERDEGFYERELFV